MGPLFYLVIVVLQLASTLATREIPLNCLLRDNHFLNIFSINENYRHHDNHNIKLPRFGVVTGKSNSFDKDGWILETNNLEFHGLDGAIVDDFGFNLVNNVAQLTFHTDMLVTYNYKTGGSLFSIPITGEGFTQVPLKNIQIGMSIPFDFVEINGKKFIELRNYNYWYDVKDLAEFSFSNLYYGNKELSDSMHYLMNKNWKFVTSQYGKGFIDYVAEKVFNVFKNHLLNMPVKDFSTC